MNRLLERPAFEPLPAPFARAYRWATAGVMLAWLVDLDTWPSYYRMHRDHPIDDAFFPGVFGTAASLPFLYIVPMVLSFAVMIVPRRIVAVAHSIVLLLGSAGLALHQSTFYVQGATASFWCAVWLLWLTSRGEEMREYAGDVVERALVLGRAVLAFVFLGAAVGKWTGGYWSGQALYYLVIDLQPTALHETLRARLDPAQLQVVASILGKLTVVTETALTGVLFLPSRFAFPLAFFAILGMLATVNPAIINAVGPLLGLALAGWSLSRAQRGSDA